MRLAKCPCLVASIALACLELGGSVDLCISRTCVISCLFAPCKVQYLLFYSHYPPFWAQLVSDAVLISSKSPILWPCNHQSNSSTLLSVDFLNLCARSDSRRQGVHQHDSTLLSNLYGILLEVEFYQEAQIFLKLWPPSQPWEYDHFKATQVLMEETIWKSLVINSHIEITRTYYDLMNQFVGILNVNSLGIYNMSPKYKAARKRKNNNN